MPKVFELPERGRRVRIYKSGDDRFAGANFLINKNTRTMDNVLKEATVKTAPVWGAVRSLHTPKTGTHITSLSQMRKNGLYVAAGTKGFYSVPGGYENIGKNNTNLKNKSKNKVIHRRRPSQRVTSITVHRNGLPNANQSVAFIFTEDDVTSWGAALSRLSTMVALPEGPVKRIYTMSGQLVRSPLHLVDGRSYVVAAEGQRFKPEDYTSTSSTVTSRAASTTNETRSSIPKRNNRQQILGSRVRKNIPSRRLRKSRSKANDEPESDEEEKSTSRFSKNSSAGSQKSYSPNVNIEIRRSALDDIKEPKTNSRFSMDGNARKSKNYSPNINLELRDMPSTSDSSKSDSRLSKNSRENSTSKGHGRTNKSNRSRRKPTSASLSEISHKELEERLNNSGGEDKGTKSKSNSSSGRRRRVSDPTDMNQRDVKYQDPMGGSRPSTQWRLSQSMNQLKLEQEKMRQQKMSNIDALYNGELISSVEAEKIQDGSTASRRTSGTESVQQELESLWLKEQRERVSSSLMAPSSRVSSAADSGRGSFVYSENDSIFKVKDKMRVPTRLTEVDYDQDSGGLFRAKSEARYFQGSTEIKDSTETNIEVPIDLIEASEVTEEVY